MSKTEQLLLNGVDITSENVNQSEPLHVIDLFAGCGGLSCGFEMAGFKSIAAVEFDEHASMTYQTNFSHPVVTADITLSETKDKLYDIVNQQLPGGNVDVICGGFPCQSFSMSGKRLDDDPRNYLYKDFVSITEYLQPKVVVGENVEGILTKHGGEDVRQIVSSFNAIGYDMQFFTLLAADYGVAQLRKRVIFVGNRINAVNMFPLPLLRPDRYVTVSEAIGSLAYLPEDYSFSQIYTRHDEEMIRRMDAVAPGCTLYSERHDSWKRLWCDRPAFTMKHNNGAPAIHPFVPRVITPREMAILQGFPNSFMFVGPKKYQYMQIGNAVPPKLGWAVAEAVKRMLL